MGIIVKEIWEMNENGESILVSTEEIITEDPTPEELLAQKEAELLKIYQEIQQMKQN
jgi:hypothetical protein